MHRALILILILPCLLLGCAADSGASAAGTKLLPASRAAVTVPRERVTAHPLAPFPYGDPERLGFSDSALERLGKQVTDWVARGQVVGAEFLIVKRGEIAWHEVIGVRDLETGEPMTPAGVFRIRSMTKPMLGTTALRLIDRGVLGLDDPASRYIPAFEAERWQDVTIQRLLQHTAGLESNSFPLDRSSYSSLRESVDDLAAVEPSRQSGAFHYSDAGSATLGSVLEAATGQSLASLLAQEVFTPLGLTDTHTSFETGVSWSGRMNSTHAWDSDAQAHRRYWHPGEAQQMPDLRASGGVYSTIFDYAVFLERWHRALRGEEPEFLAPTLARSAVRQATEEPYGMHWETVDGEDHTPALFGHGGSDGTLALCIPEEDLLLLFFTQSRRCDCRDQFAILAGITREFGALAEHGSLGRWRDPEPEIEPISLSDSDRARYAGWYDVRGSTVEIRDEGGVLLLVRGVTPPRDPSRNDTDTQVDGGSVVCFPSLAVPFPSVDLIPLGDNRFALGRFDGGRVTERYWPGCDLLFQEHDGRVIGYELEYDPQVIERARKYRWKAGSPAPKREPLPDDFRAAIGGTYQSGPHGIVEVQAFSDHVELAFGSDVETLWYQGAGFFRSDRGDVVTFARDPATGDWRLRILESAGSAYEFKRETSSWVPAT